MKFKNYQNIKIKHYLKNYSLLFLGNGINQNSTNQLLVKQKLKKLKTKYYKTYNKLTIKTFINSTYKNITTLIYSPIFFITQRKNHLNILIIKYLKKLAFSSVLGIKLNKRIYSITQIKNLKSSNYKNIIVILYQFLVINLKFIQITNKFSKQCDLNT